MITKKPWTLSSGYLFLAIIFGGISYGAYNLTEGGTIIPNAHTSPDCVWYNGGMALACVVIICFLWILKLFRPTREIEKISWIYSRGHEGVKFLTHEARKDFLPGLAVRTFRNSPHRRSALKTRPIPFQVSVKLVFTNFSFMKWKQRGCLSTARRRYCWTCMMDQSRQSLSEWVIVRPSLIVAIPGRHNLTRLPYQKPLPFTRVLCFKALLEELVTFCCTFMRENVFAGAFLWYKFCKW